MYSSWQPCSKMARMRCRCRAERAGDGASRSARLISWLEPRMQLSWFAARPQVQDRTHPPSQQRPGTQCSAARRRRSRTVAKWCMLNCRGPHLRLSQLCCNGVGDLHHLRGARGGIAGWDTHARSIPQRRSAPAADPAHQPCSQSPKAAAHLQSQALVIGPTKAVNELLVERVGGACWGAGGRMGTGVGKQTGATGLT